MTMEEFSAMQTLFLGAWGKGRNWSKYCSVDNIGGYCYFICGWNVFLIPFLYFCYRCSIHLHTWTHTMHSTHTFNSPPYILIIKIILWCAHQPSSKKCQGLKDLRLLSGTGKHWLYSLDVKSDTNLSLLFGKHVAHIWFQLSAENPQNSSHWCCSLHQWQPTRILCTYVFKNSV